jgi:methylated-DNA-[protein]-cysteine S-methyltransferase
MVSKRHIILDSPLGRLILFEEDDALTALYPMDLHDYQERIKQSLAASLESNSKLLLEAADQLKEYFNGQRWQFTLPIRPIGSDFQQNVLQALRQIPYGKTLTYGKLAAMIGNPKAARAVGNALHNNPLPIIIPCHRILPSNSGIGGFAWGIKAKRLLLGVES